MNHKNKLYNIIAKQFSVNLSDINDKQEPGDINGWDSIGQIQLILQIEESFGLTLSVNDILSINNIGDFLKIINKK